MSKLNENLEVHKTSLMVIIDWLEGGNSALTPDPDKAMPSGSWESSNTSSEHAGSKRARFTQFLRGLKKEE